MYGERLGVMVRCSIRHITGPRVDRFQMRRIQVDTYPRHAEPTPALLTPWCPDPNTRLLSIPWDGSFSLSPDKDGPRDASQVWRPFPSPDLSSTSETQMSWDVWTPEHLQTSSTSPVNRRMVPDLTGTAPHFPSITVTRLLSPSTPESPSPNERRVGRRLWTMGVLGRVPWTNRVDSET